MKVSVVIPVYNVEKYIKQCLESMINQTLNDIEILIVNDGTKDNSMNIVKEYIADQRIRIINKENGGVSSARNVGIREAKGEYIYFIDSDDWVEKDILKTLYDENNAEDIIFTNFIYYKDTTGDKRNKKYKFPDKSCKKEGKYFFYNDAEVLVWNRLYRREFLLKNNLLFPEGIIHEDEEFSFKSLMLAEKVKYIESYKFYYRTSREGSITYKINYPKVIYSLEKISKNFLEFSLNEKLDKFQKMRSLLRAKIIEFRAKSYKKEVVEYSEFIEIEKNYKEYFKYERISNLEKKLLVKDIQKLILSKNFIDINLLDNFYYKYGIFRYRILKRIIKKKIKYKLWREVDYE